MREWLRQRLGVRSLSLALSVMLCGATAGLAWLAYGATRENQTATRRLVDQRVRFTRDSVARALMRNMKDVQTSLLTLDPIAVAEDPYALRETFARTFARFSYPESFFIGTPGGVYLFHREQRLPAWAGTESRVSPFSVLVQRDPTQAQALLASARKELSGRSRFAVFEWSAGTEPYQVVVRRMGDDGADRLRLVGFTVSHRWTRDHYFGEVIRHMASISASDTGYGSETPAVSMAIVDDNDRIIVSTGAIEEGTVQEQRFPLIFHDPALSSTLAPHTPPAPKWRIRVGAIPGWDRVSETAASRTLLLLVGAAVLALSALLVTVRAVRVRDELAGMKSDFVANVTHELKTPLAVICAASDTIAMGRYTPETLHEYSQILSRRARELTRLIENMLTFARAADGRTAYAFERLDAGDLVEDAADDAWPLLQEKGFEVAFDIPAERLQVRADPTWMRHVLRNLIDNAIKYSEDVRHLTLSVRSDGRDVRIEVADRGRGIPEHDQARVFGRFERGRDVRVGGSGLGLAIVRRIVTDHGGRVALSSEAGRGTTLSVILPRAA